MSLRNYEVYADIGPKTQLLRRVLAILATGVGPNLISISKLLERMEAHLKLGPLPEVFDANGKSLSNLTTV